MPKMIERGFFSSAIQLSDQNGGAPSAVSPDVQILRVGSFNHPKYGEFEITTVILQEMLENFGRRIRGIDIALDYFHESDQAASGWLKELYLTENGQELWGKVDWTPKARKMLAEREIRYFSPDFAFEWTDPESEITYQNVLFGGGLTNRPFVKDMAAIVAAENKGEEMTLKEIEDKLKKLAEDNTDLAAKHSALQAAHADLLAKHGALQKKLDDADGDDAGDDSDEDSDPDDQTSDPVALKKQLAAAKAQLAEYAEKAKAADAAKQMAEKETKFTVLLSEGKACAAQKKAYMDGNMEEFVKLAEKTNLVTRGSGGGSGNEGSNDRDDRVLKLAEEKCKADPKLKKIDAITQANREIKE